MSMLELVLEDLRAEAAELDGRVAGLPDADWARATPAAGWTIAHQIAHLHWTDQMALHAVDDPSALHAIGAAAAGDPAGLVDRAAAAGAALPPAELLAGWRAGREQLLARLRTVPPDRKLDWFGPPMSATSMATARLMETWAHGLDVAEALGQRPEPTNRLQHIARLAVRTRDFAFRLHDLTPPVEEFRIELTAPDGGIWSFGPEQARESVAGPALDLCLLAAQRSHRSDLALVATGATADRWLDIIQMFAGPPGGGRSARS